VVKVVLDAKATRYFSRSQIPYPREGVAKYRHAGIYGYRMAFLSAFRAGNGTD
jgi:CMP-2-keto-3-deoxyoctulosonic acid synthetase